MVWRVPRGLEKQASTASALLMECKWSAAVLNDQQRDLREASGILIEISRLSDWSRQDDFRRLGRADALAQRLHQDSTRTLLHPLAISNNGPRANASHRPIGVKSEFPQRQYTPPRAANKRRKCNPRSPIGWSRTYRVNAHWFGPHSCRPCQLGGALDRSGTG